MVKYIKTGAKYFLTTFVKSAIVLAAPGKKSKRLEAIVENTSFSTENIEEKESPPLDEPIINCNSRKLKANEIPASS